MEDEDGVGGFDSLKTDEDFNRPDGGASGGGEEEEEELDGELGPRSTFERNQLKLRKNIESLETKNIGEKDWETMGEIQGKMRPENSLLGSVLDFQHAGKLKPVSEHANQTHKGHHKTPLLLALRCWLLSHWCSRVVSI